tara:strand:+ start:374 stop:1129 length:756 start_codon:yes stop_codon:yes gene_type:complete
MPQMKTIALRTTQNVEINYKLATLRDRNLAFFIDVMAIMLGVIVLTFIIALIEAAMTSLGFSGALIIGYYAIISPLMAFYTLAMEALNKGQTLGKMALGIQVIRVDGRQANFMDYLIRWVFRILDVWFSFGALAAILIGGSVRSQRIGGVLSNTTVVKQNPNLQVSLADLMKKDTLDNYTPVYPEVRNFKESDMLLMKQTLERYTKYRNKAHEEALFELVTRVSKEMQVDIPQKKVEFIQTLIRDYIVLTR